jgi:hypothetical protein
MDAHIIKKYIVLLALFWISQTQVYRDELRKSLQSKPSITPLTVYEIVVSAVVLFGVYVFAETLIVNDVF